MPSLANLVAMLLAALLLMGSPGPATISVAAAGAAFGPRPVVPYLCGICLGTMAVLLVVATGVTGFVLSVPGATPVINALAGAYILYLAWRIATAPPPGRAEHGSDAPPFLGGLLLAVANPKAYAAIGAVYAGSTLIADPLADAGAKVAVLSGVIWIVNSTWMLFGAGIAGLMREPRSGRILNVVFAVLLVAAFALSLVDW